MYCYDIMPQRRWKLMLKWSFINMGVVPSNWHNVVNVEIPSMSPPTGGVNGPEAKVVLPYCWHLLRILTPYPLCWPHQILHMHDPAITEGRHDPKTVGEGVLCILDPMQQLPKCVYWTYWDIIKRSIWGPWFRMSCSQQWQNMPHINTNHWVAEGGGYRLLLPCHQRYALQV